MREKLLQLSGKGIVFAIDDFGTGYSSLAYLQHFPVQKLKIDRSFVQGLTHSGADPNAKLIKAIVELSRALSLGVCAEGVETRRQAELLIGLGCERLQGFLYSQPLPTAEFTRLLAAGAPLG